MAEICFYFDHINYNLVISVLFKRKQVNIFPTTQMFSNYHIILMINVQRMCAHLFLNIDYLTKQTNNFISNHKHPIVQAYLIINQKLF